MEWLYLSRREVGIWLRKGELSGLLLGACGWPWPLVEIRGEIELEKVQDGIHVP